MKHLNFILSEDKKQRLDLYLHESSLEMRDLKNRPMVLVFPGGGYSFCSDREADPVAFKYFGEGFHSGVLRYCVGKNRDFKIALKEASDSIRLIRDCAVEWNIDPNRIYVLGFSAGGHLAAAVSNLGDYKPNGCLLGHPALLGSFAYLMNVDAPSLEQCVTAETPPTFLFTTFGDDLVPVENTIRYMQALENHEVPFEAHIFEKGGHGLSVADRSINKTISDVDRHFASWFGLSVEWLRLQTKQNVQVNDHAIRNLMKHEILKTQLIALIPMLNDPEIYKIVRNFPLSRVLDFYYGTLSPDAVEDVKQIIGDSELKKYI